MHLSLSTPSYTSPSVKILSRNMDNTIQDDTIAAPLTYPLSTATTPPSIKYSSFDSSIPNSLTQHSKDYCTSHLNPQNRTPRKRSVTFDDCILPFNTSFKRARIKSTDDTSVANTQDSTTSYFSGTAFPSPSPTPISQHPTWHQEQERQGEQLQHRQQQQQHHQHQHHQHHQHHQKQKQRQLQQLQQQQQQQSLLSPHQNINDPTILNAIWNMPNIIDTYDTLPTSTKSYLIFQLLKRSSASSLKFVNSLIMPILKRDMLASLPHEVALQVIRYLDVRSLCRAATVSKTWRSIVDHDRAIWRSLLEKDGLGDKNELGSRPERRYRTRSLTPSPLPPIRTMEERNIESINNNTGNNMNEGIQHMSEPMDIDDDNNTNCSNDDENQNVTPKGKERALPSIYNPYKNDYRRRHILRDNWQRGRFKRSTFPGHNITGQSVVTCLQFDDDKIISGVDDRVINIYETKTGRHISQLFGHEGGVWALQYIGNTLVSGSTDRTVRVWDIERAVCTHVFLGHTSTVRCLQIVMPTMVDGQLKPAQPLIVTGSRDSTLRVWRLPDPRTDPPFNGNGVNPWYMHTLTGHGLSVRAITAHGNTLVSGSYDNAVNVWNLETGRLVHRLHGHHQKVYAVVIDPERKRCYSGSMDGSIRVWDYVSGICLQILEGHTILVGLLGLTKNHLTSAGADGILRVWDPDTGICRHVLSGHDAAITCFQHDEHKVISGSEGGLKMWDIKTGRHIKDLITDHVDGVWRVAFDKHRCVAAVYKNDVTSFEVLDFSVHGLENLED
ncbi:WD40-repeat-containing domain protein [Absidia repens]|uniref:WD40-repeat-containing domain protein n=1 Tax=Absidia repens TaxID=90262 RepID=A0A1X2I6N4_9FUNG|nr:WD40-repeat-containing domain protein [Absidia repens]